MGNVLDLESKKDGYYEEDLEFLSVQNSAIFNEGFLGEIYDSLPEFEETSLPLERENEVDGEIDSNSDGVKRLLQIFSKDSGGAASRVVDFPLLSPKKELDRSMLSVSNKMRLRLLKRIHMAYLRCVQAVQEQGGDSALNRSNISNSGDVDKKIESGDSMLVATSIRMSLSILQCLGPSNPELFSSVSVSMLDLLANCSDFALTCIEENTPQSNCLEAITAFAIKSAEKETIAVSSGSLSGLLKVVSLLLNGKDALPSQSKLFLKRLADKKNPLLLSTPDPDSICGGVVAKFDMIVDNSDVGKYESDFCVDGKYLYVYDGCYNSIRKIGTGFHGTIAGNEYVSSKNVLQQLRDFLGLNIFEIDPKCVSSTLESVESVSGADSGRIFTNESVVLLNVQSHITDGVHLDVALREEFQNTRRHILQHRSASEGVEYRFYEERAVMVDGNSVEFYRVGDYDWVPNMMYATSHTPGTHSDENSDNTYMSPLIDDVDDDDDDDDDLDSSQSTLSMVEVVQVVGESNMNEYDSNNNTDENGIMSSHRRGWICTVEGKLYLRLEEVLGPFRIAVFSCKTLKLKDVVYVDLSIPELIRARYDWHQNKYDELLYYRSNGDRDVNDGIIAETQQHLTNCERYISEFYPSGLLYSDADADGEGLICYASRPLANIHRASSNFYDSQEVLNNLLARDEDWCDSIPFLFDEMDECPHIIVDMGTLMQLSSVGCLFSSPEYEMGVQRFEVSASIDDNEYFDFGHVESFSDSIEPVMVRRQVHSDVDSNGTSYARYIKLAFKRQSSSKLSLSRILICGQKKPRKNYDAPALAMTSDGQNLLFVGIKNIKDDDSDKSTLCTYLVSPGEMQFIEKQEYALRLLENECLLYKCSFVFNGALLILSHPKDFMKRAKGKKEAHYSFQKFDVKSGKSVSSCNHVFVSAKGVPTALTYDLRNNMIWGWDMEALKFIRWRNAGLQPSRLSAKPQNASDMLLSQHPQYRIEALMSQYDPFSDPIAQAALILSHLDRLSLPFGPPWLPRAENKTLNEIEVTSAGFEDGDFAQFVIRGQIYYKCSRGFNVLTLDSSFQPKDFRNFDTHGASEASERMADFIETIPDGTIVLAAVMDSAYKNLTMRGKSSLNTIGAKNMEKLDHRSSFALIGKKSEDSVCIKQKMCPRRGGEAVVRHQIPLVKVPLSYECTQSTLHSLVSLSQQFHNRIRQCNVSITETSILVSCMRLLMTNIYQLLEGMSVEDAQNIFSKEDRKVTIRIVNDLIENPSECVGGMAISEIALSLYINAIDILYPSSQEKCTLLVNYLDAYNSDKISRLKSSVVALLLQQLADSYALIRLFNKQDANAATVCDPQSLYDSLLLIAKKDALARLEDVRVSSTKPQHTSVGEAAVQVLSTVCNMILSQAIQSVVSSTKNESLEHSDQACSDMAFQQCCKTLVSMLESSTDVCAAILQSGLLINQELQTDKNGLKDDIDAVLKQSLVGMLLPSILNVVAIVFEDYGPRMLESYHESSSTKLVSCLKATQAVVECVPVELLQHEDAGKLSGTRSSGHVYESEHPYQSNMDECTELNFPNAIRMTFTFDERTRTELNYDWMRIWKDSSKTELLHPNVDKYTGRNGSENWPGFGGRPPLVVEGSQAYIEFHSDSSNEDWGYRLMVQVEYKRKTETRTHWLVELENQLVFCGSVISSNMIVGVPWDSDVEEQNSCWMESNLVDGVTYDEEGIEQNELHLTFLEDFLERPQESLAYEFCHLMKKRVVEDKGQVEVVNRAVYATCAALLLHNNLVGEAISLALNEGNVPSEDIVKVWKVGQKMRSYFDYGDLKNQSHDENGDYIDGFPLPHAIERGPSVYSGSETALVQAAAERVLSRASFLLRTNSVAEKSEIIEEKAWKFIENSRNDSWCQAAEKLRASFKCDGSFASLQRTSSSASPVALSVSEKILRFVQSSVDVKELESLRNIRNKRAILRAKGFDLLQSLVGAAATPFSLKWLFSTFSIALRDSCPPNQATPKLHYLNAVEGCSHDARMPLVSSFCGFVDKCVSLMERSFYKASKQSEKRRSASHWKQVTISCLRALALDYDVFDHDILRRSNFLPLLHRFLQDCNDLDIYKTSLNVFEVLFHHCLDLWFHQKDSEQHKSTEFCKDMMALLISEICRASKRVDMRRLPCPDDSLVGVPGCINLLPRTVEISRECLGFTAPHVNMGLKSSVSFWFKRHRYSVDSLFEQSEELTAAQLVGSCVVQGPDWNPLHLENGSNDSVGTIMSYDEDTKSVKVKWSENKNTGNYKFGKLEDGTCKYEVVLADKSIQGHIYSKGMRALLSDDDRAFVWSTFGLEITPDARLQMFAAKDEDSNFCASCKEQIPPDIWTHISVVQDERICRLFMNGQLDSEHTLLPSMMYPDRGAKEKEVVESSHPYRDNTISYTEVAIEGAVSYTISFDPRTRTEQGHDFLRFYKDSSHTDYWGSDKYSGGRSGSRSNWPGLNGHPPLVIPASKFVVFFKSDGSNNDWGYRMTCVAEKNETFDESRATIQVLNKMPFYIGQTPTYVDNLPSVPSASGYISGFCVFGNKVLSSDDIESLMSSSRPNAENGIDDEHLCLDVLATISKSQNSFAGFSSCLLKSSFIGSDILFPLFNIMAHGTAHAQISCIRVCSSLLSVYPEDIVNEQANRVGLARNSSFIMYVFDRIGTSKNAYASRSLEGLNSSPAFHFCDELEYGIGLEYLNLLNCLLASDNWAAPISDIVMNVIENIGPRLLVEIKKQIVQETSLGFSSNFISGDISELHQLLTVFGLCGGSFSGLYLGSPARCTVGDDNGIIEDCIMLNASWPPSEEELEAMSKSSDVSKFDIDKWKDKTNFADAFYVVLASQPCEPLLVPRDKVNIERSYAAPSLKILLNKFSHKFVSFFNDLCSVDCTDMRPKHVPRTESSDEIQEFESDHPYVCDSEKTFTISFPGASSMTITFDRRTRTDPNTSVLTFFKNESKNAHWGKLKYCGRDASQSWPGVNGQDPLVIPSDSCVVHFHSEGPSNDWGFKFTAVAHCVIKVCPPERPPLLHNAIASQVKHLGLTALCSMIKQFSWFSLDCMPILGRLVSSALSPLPETELKTVRPKPVELESKHPYDHNMDEYYSVRIPGAKKLQVVFDEQTCTENGADFVRFYKDDSHSDHWGDHQYTGGKDGGSCNWPGIQGRAPLVIPSNSFVVYFKTDGSVNAWGYKMYISSIDDDVDSVPNLDPKLCSFRAHCNHMVIRDCGVHLSDPDGLETFDTESGVFQANEDTCSSSKSDNDSDRDLPVRPGKRNSHSLWPMWFKVNSSDAHEIKVYVETSTESDVVMVADTTTSLLVDGEKGDWLHVIAMGVLPFDSDGDFCSDSDTAERKQRECLGWVLRRRGDMIFMISEDSLDSTVFPPDWLNVDEVLGSCDATSKDKHPMYEVDETSLSDVYGSNYIQPTPLESLTSESRSHELCAVEMCQLGCIASSQDCIFEILHLWPKDKPFTLDCFESTAELMNYLRSAFMRDTGAGLSIGCKGSRLDVLKGHILTAIRSEEPPDDEVVENSLTVKEDATPSLCNDLMSFAISQLSSSLKSEKSLRPTMGKLVVVECKHPYEDNMDEYWDIHVPGASSLKIVFDSRCSTERDCDYVSIHDDRTKTTQYGQRFTGRKRSHDKVWAGLGNLKPLDIPGNSCVVYFHSDSSNTDWGFKLYCYAIMSEPTNDEREDHENQKRSSSRPFASLACWMLEFLAKEPLPSVQRNLYTVSTILILRRYIEVMPPKKKCFAIYLITNMLQEMPQHVLVKNDVFNEISILKNAVVELASKHYKIDYSSRSSSSSSSASQLLQALVQCCIVLGECIQQFESARNSAVQSHTCLLDEESVTSSCKLIWNTSNFDQERVSGDEKLLHSRCSSKDNETTIMSLQGFSGGIHKCHVEFVSISESGPMVGLTCSGMSGKNLQNFSVLVNAKGSLIISAAGNQTVHEFGNAIVPGDVLSIVLDLNNKVVTYHCNQAYIGTAIGPVNSGAVHEMNLSEAVKNSPLHFCARLTNEMDKLRLTSPPPPYLAPKISCVGVNDWPSWFFPVREAMTLLKSCSARELPSTVLSQEFLPSCEDDESVVIQSSHPYDGLEYDELVHIPLADALTVRFHSNTSMGQRDIITIEGDEEYCIEKGIERPRYQFTGLSGGCDSSLHQSENYVAVGDKVVRGPAWEWGNQDGGVGGIGEVVDISTWKGIHNAGVAVKWSRNNFEGLYRWDVEGLYDLLVIARSASENHKRPLRIMGDRLKFRVTPGGVSAKRGDVSLEWNGSCYLNGTSSFIQLPRSRILELSYDLTVECWIKVSTASSLCPCLPILSRHIEVDEKVTQFALQLGSVDGDCDNTTLVMEGANTLMQSAFRLQGGFVQHGAWTHVCGVVSGSMTALFVNGSLVAANSFTGTRLYSLGAPLFVGKSLENQYFKGNIYDLRIWSKGRPLSAIRDEKDSPVSSWTDIPTVLVYSLGCSEKDMLFEGAENWMKSAVGNCEPAQLFDVSWDHTVEPHTIPPDTNFGFHITITPSFSLQTLLSNPKFAKRIRRLRRQYTTGELRHDLALVRYVNSITRSRKMKIDQLLRCEWKDIAPSSDELTAMPVLKELLGKNLDIEDTEESNVEDNAKQEAAEPSVSPAEARFGLLKLLNKALSQTIQYVDLYMMDKSWSLAHLLTLCRGLVFEVTKLPVWENALKATAVNSCSKFDLCLSRSRAAKHRRTGLPDNEARWMVFSQAFRQMHTMSPASLRRSDQLFYTTFAGERAHDAGGPYREAFAMMYLELQSPFLPLLIKTPNGRHSVGQNREKWVLNPSATSSLHLDMFSFLGKLMGIAIRSKEFMELDLPSIIWKLLVHEIPNRDDLEAIDLFQIQSLDNMRNIDKQGVDRESFPFTFYETFTTLSTDNRQVELVTGGREKSVNFDNRNQYCDLIEEYRFHEFDVQAAAVRRGLATIIPHRLLSLFTWDQLEVMVCGNAKIDISLLKSVTEYSSCSTTDSHVQYFWQILEDFTEEEKSAFLRFVWGRSRLPLTPAGFAQRFKLQHFGKQPADQYLPVAHTCFFSLEFPSYSSLEVAREKLRYAIFNCQAIDGDDTSVGMQAAAIGWED